MNFENFDLYKIGNTLEIKGILYGNNEENILILLPKCSELKNIELMYCDLEQWKQIVRQSDLLEVKVVDNDHNKKVIVRKSVRQIEQHIAWSVFRRDGYKCRYCANDEVPLTVDHIVLWEHGGPTIEENLISACKKCNNTRGNMVYPEWIKSEKYAKVSVALTPEEKKRNEEEIPKILEILKNHMRTSKRSR